MNEHEGTDEIIKPALNEILKPYGLKLVLVDLNNNIEHEPEKVVNIANHVALANVSLEIRKTGLPEIVARDTKHEIIYTLKELATILQRLSGMKIEFSVVGE